MSGTGQAFNSPSSSLSFVVTKGHGANTQRNDVLEEETNGGGDAENKIKEACILYTAVRLSHGKRENLAAKKSFASTEAFFCVFEASRGWYGGCVCVAYIC